MAGWRLADSLEVLRSQVNDQFPNRSKRSDGTIGDAAHRTRESDHNPWVKHGTTGVVTALDLTHDPRAGFDSWALAECLRSNKDARIKYVISNKRIFSSTTSPWTWRSYRGSNPHIAHVHISVRHLRTYYDDKARWEVDWGEKLDMANHEPDEPDPDSPASRPVLRVGSRGEHVRIVQRVLELDQVDGVFGTNTSSAVIAFQRREKLRTDGIVGLLTWRALDAIEQVVLPYNYDIPRPLSEPTQSNGPSQESNQEGERV